MKKQENEIKELRKIVNVFEPLQHILDEEKVLKLA
jgi:flagellin-specific chaperone FliS